MPANGTEGAGFEERWCARCANDDPDTGDICEILGNAHCGVQPSQWVVEAGRPRCTAFVPYDGLKPLPEPRCPFTMEMFP